MPSHSRHSRHKATIPKALRKGQKPSPSRRNKKTTPIPQAPGELNAILGYGTSSSFPLFTTGITAGIKKIFGHKNTRG